jgi:chaperonin cofactor prefoldin
MADAFANCTGFTDLSIGNTVTLIELNAFYGCSGLTELTIGNSVLSIGSSAFGNCTGLTGITSLVAIPPTLGATNPFVNVPPTIPVLVSCKYLSSYQTSWSHFSNISCGEITVLSNDTNLGGVNVDDVGLSGTLYAAPKANAAIFTGWSDGNTDNPRKVTVTGSLTLTANFAANNTAALQTQVTSLQNDLNTANNTISALQSDKAALNAQITSLQNDLNTANGTISALESDIASLNAQITTLQNQLDVCDADKNNLQTLLDDCINDRTGTRSVHSAPPLTVYPNPVSPNGVLHIKDGDLRVGDRMEIFDMRGVLISVTIATDAENAIHIGGLSSGTYLLRLSGNRGVKFVVK